MRRCIELAVLAFCLLATNMAGAQFDPERACPNCTAFYCPANPETKRLLAEKRKFARDHSYPKRILNLLEQVNPVCPACLEQAPTFPMVYVHPPGPGELPQVWSPGVERSARLRYRAGRIEAFYIRWLGPCDCCGARRSTNPFDSSGAPREGIGIRDGVLRYETREQVDAVTDLAGKKRPVPEKQSFEDPKPPRVAQALCPQCAAAAEAINKAEEAHFSALLEDVRRKRTLEDIKVGRVQLANALIDLYRDEDAGRIATDRFLSEEMRIGRRVAQLDNRWISLVSGPEYKRIKEAIEHHRKEAQQALVKAQECEARACRKPQSDRTTSGKPPARDSLAGAPPDRHGLKPKLICGRFPERYREPCFPEILKYYTAAETHAAAKQAAPNSRATCLKGCDFVRAPWVLADWARSTALRVIVENRDEALGNAVGEKRRAELNAWFEQAEAFWSENNTSISSCTAAQADRRHANCRGGCTGGAGAGGALTCAIHPLNAATQYRWLSNLYPPGAPQLAGISPDTPAAVAQRQQILDMLRSAERPLGSSAPVPALPQSPPPALRPR